MPITRQEGPVEAQLRSSDRKDVRCLCELSNLELLDRLDQLIQSPGDEMDDELFDAIQNLLNERAPVEADVDPQRSFQEFEEKHADLFKEVRVEKDPKSKGAHRHLKLKTAYHIVAAVVIVCGALMIGAIANGRDPIVMVRDAGETLIRSITWGPSGELTIQDAVTGYSSLEAALDDVGASDAQKITWIPSAFHLDSVDVRLPGESIFEVWAYYKSKDGDIIFSISHQVPDKNIYQSEKEETAFQIQVDGITYIAVQNSGWTEVQWICGDYSYQLTGTLSNDEVKSIIQSLK